MNGIFARTFGVLETALIIFTTLNITTVEAASVAPSTFVASAPAYDVSASTSLPAELSILMLAALMLTFAAMAATLLYCIWKDAKPARQAASHARAINARAKAANARSGDGWRAAPYLAFASLVAMIGGHTLSAVTRLNDGNIDGRKSASQIRIGKDGVNEPEDRVG